MTTLTDLAPPLSDEAALLDWVARMREGNPVWEDRGGNRHVFRHDDVRTVLRDTTTFSSDLSGRWPACRRRLAA